MLEETALFVFVRVLRLTASLVATTPVTLKVDHAAQAQLRSEYSPLELLPDGEARLLCDLRWILASDGCAEPATRLQSHSDTSNRIN